MYQFLFKTVPGKIELIILVSHNVQYSIDVTVKEYMYCRALTTKMVNGLKDQKNRGSTSISILLRWGRIRHPLFDKKQ